ncbi:MAG: OmpA family protein [Bacteroidetes bacterium]|nr:OmpA family protein [Bacteroidota bacterium]MBU1485945.1 OmpA family protein [Bacteroidota bacterium]MBU2267887.1 OmpA family protein [Bacteroidota bacterium]MBU2377088.1 OmpA family protein [Bacteroidota bacterium]
MTHLKIKFFVILTIFSCSLLSLTSCKSKKLAVKEEVAPPPPAEPKPEPAPIVKDTDGDGVPDDQDKCPEVKGSSANEGCPEEKPKAFNSRNIQFEFNSSVLKTESYDILEGISQQMKKNPSATYELAGNSSAEGTEKRNMMLSVDRANSVKAYLVNNGIDGARLKTKGLGESNPIADNSTEAGRIKNRRVEIKSIN